VVLSVERRPTPGAGAGYCGIGQQESRYVRAIHHSWQTGRFHCASPDDRHDAFLSAIGDTLILLPEELSLRLLSG
jgi:hypothetical protein